MKEADLHMHTKASDGTDTLSERIEDAKEKDLDVIAITDHDTINEELGNRSFTAENGTEVITGAEIKCQIDGTQIEILAYFIDPEAKEIQELLEELSERREKRMRKFVENLNNAHSLELEAERIIERNQDNVGRPHLGQALIDRGVVDTHQEAFDKYIGSQHDEYVPIEKMKAEKVIKKVKDNGGVTSLAHPGRNLKKHTAEEAVEKLASKGLDGIEVEYTYEERRNKKSYSISFGKEKAEALAEKFDLIKTGGSDCHGSGSDKYFLGRVRIPYERVEALKQISCDNS